MYNKLTKVIINLLINEISIILPALDEDNSITPVVNELFETFETLDLNYEIIVVDDGSVNSVKNYLQESDKLKVISNEFTRDKVIHCLKDLKQNTNI